MSAALLTIDHVSHAFGGLRALDDVCLAFDAGAIAAIIGPNGAGKTTLFSIVAGVIRPAAGRVLLRGADITGVGASRACRAGVGRTFQVVRPFWQLTVRDHVRAAALFARGAAPEDELMRVLEITRLAEIREREARTLTLADCRRLEIARALATGAPLLLLDETMAGLSPGEIEEAAAVVRRIREDDPSRTIVLIEHLMAAVTDLCERAVVLDEGRVIADGPPADVLRRREVKRAYLGE